LSALEFDHWLELTPLFQGASSENIAYVAQIVQLKHYHKGEIVFTQDSEATGFFVIKTGRVKIFKLAAQGKSKFFIFLASKNILQKFLP